MAYNALNNLIDAYIYQNGVQAITGSILNNVLKAMVSQLGGGYNLMGVAAPASSPAVNDEPLAYFAATAGTYTNFDGIVLAAGEVAVLLTSGNGSWSKQTIYNVPTGTADLVNTAGFITNAVDSLVNYYTKTEINGQKAETDAALADRYTKTETDTKLAEYYKKTETYDKDEVDSIVAALSRQEYIVAWDGLSTPDVSAIPAGVTVTYSGTTYIGTLAASASTVNKIYMVWNGVAYDMYGTSAGGGYSWVPMGTTSVDMSQYATKDEFNQLQREVGILNNTQVQYTTSPGYISSDGTINTPSIEQNEKTSSFIPIVVGSKYRFLISFENSRSIWCAYCLYDASEQSLGRVVMVQSVSAQRASYDVTIDNPNAAYIRFTWRAYSDGKEGIFTGESNEWQNEVLGKISKTNARVDNIVVSHINLLEGLSVTPGYVYSHGSGSKDPVASASIYDSGIPVSAGEVLYYKNLYPFFCGIRKLDNSWTAMSNDSTWNMSGEYVVPEDGLLYITKNNNAPDNQLLTRDKFMYDNDIFESYEELNPEKTGFAEISEKISSLETRTNKIDADVENVESQLGEILIQHINLLYDANKTTGYVYRHSNGTIDPADTSSIYDEGIPVVAGETLYYKNLYPFFCGIRKSSDDTWVAMSNDSAWNASGEYVVPDDGLLYITINNAAPDHQLLTRDKSMYDDDEIESSVEINPEMLPDVGQKVFHIGSTREYTTLRAGISEAIKSANSLVYVDAGTYDLTQEFAAEIAAQGTTQYGIKLENGVHVIFSPGAVVNALYQGTVQNVVRYFSPFYSGLNGGGFTLEGLTLYAKNTRYCVHDEMDGVDVITRNRYINCKMVYDGSTSPYNYYQNCIGGGTAKYSYVEIVNCYFDTTGTMTDPSTVSYHNANVAGAKSTIIVSNCYFAHGTFRLGYYGPSELMSRAFVNNCSFEVAPLIRAENQTAEIVNWEMVSFMNEIRS